MSQWERVQTNAQDRERIWSVPRTFAGDVWFRFRKKPTALAGFLIVVFLLCFAVFGPYLSPYGYSDQSRALANIPPILSVSDAPDGNYLYVTPALKVILIGRDGKLLGQLSKGKDDETLRRIAYTLDAQTEVYLDYSQKPAMILSAEGERTPASKQVWNTTYLLGTDQLGRDILTRLMYGARISLMVAFVAATINMVIGILYGGIAGFVGGRADAVMMRVVDIISTIPLTLYVILIKVTLDNGLLSIIIALSSVYWVDMARVVRGQVLSLKQQEFVLASRAIGSSNRTIMLTHLIPNAMGPILVTVTMLIPSAIFVEAFMSFIGIGIAPPMASLGTMCNDAMEALRSNPYQLFLPALVICLIMFAFNFVGDGLRDALDPKLKK
ncbi:MAG: ABC transporter permease [Clostridiales bacterium]|nr:ABC transporter permease [Clostridiales bacterium]